jgi:hypothetical protein
MAAKLAVEIDYNAATNDAADMPFRQLERRCARTAAKAGKFLASARAILEADLPYFLELRQRLNAQGQRRFDIEGWTRWCEKHFSCSVRTVNRALSSLLGPEKERKKSRRWRAPAEALIAATEPALRLARRHENDPDASEFLSLLEEAALEGLITEPPAWSPSYLDNLQKERRIKKAELYKMGLHLAEAVVEDPGVIRGETPQGKKILGIAKHILEIKKKAGDLTLYQKEPQDEMSRSAGSNFVVDEKDGIRVPPQKANKASEAASKRRVGRR